MSRKVRMALFAIASLVAISSMGNSANARCYWVQNKYFCGHANSTPAYVRQQHRNSYGREYRYIGSNIFRRTYGPKISNKMKRWGYRALRSSSRYKKKMGRAAVWGAKKVGKWAKRPLSPLGTAFYLLWPEVAE